MTFDPDAAAKLGSGIFGLPHTRAESRIVLFPVPFDATTSYGGGASGGPAAILRASAQVDLLDHQFGAVYQQGIFMEEAPPWLSALSRTARELAAPVIARGGAEAGDQADAAIVAEVNAASERMNAHVYERTAAILAEGKVPGLVGGDHSTPLGCIRAAAEHVARHAPEGLGVLHVDAHMDLREAFEGFACSHASIMWNVLARVPGVTRLVQVGIRDYGANERAVAEKSGGRVRTHYDFDWFTRLSRGERLEDLCREAVEPLPRNVYVSFDIDALDPCLCPRTGTPVPGGLSFNAAATLLGVLRESGRTVVAFDLNEVGADPQGEDEWDANVGARMLYKLCGCAAPR
ncbi:MAG: arginase family protein [Planctomycetota bacterium]|nr:arginase family protein [Planctomycetota bacterium]